MAVVNLQTVHQIKMEIHFSFFLHHRINEYGLIIEESQYKLYEIFNINYTIDKNFKKYEMSPNKVLVFAIH